MFKAENLYYYTNANLYHVRGISSFFELDTVMILEVFLMSFPPMFSSPIRKSIVISALMALALVKIYEIFGCLESYIAMTHNLLSNIIDAM